MVTKPAPKEILMPSKAELLGRLKQRSQVLGLGSTADGFYDHYVGSLANRTQGAKDLQTAWEQAAHRCLSNYPANVAVAIGLNFDAVVRAIAPELAQEAINFRNSILRT